MKKIIIELVATLGIVVSFFFFGGIIKNSVYAVDVYRVTSTRVEDTVICSGKIAYKKACEVTPTANGIVSEVMVEKGESVQKGDVLFSMITDLSSDNITSIDSASLADIVDDKSMNVTAPVSGIVLSVDIKKEDAVTNTVTAVTIVNSDNLCVNIPVSESKITNIKTGQPVKITGSAFGKSSYSGVVDSIDNVAKQVVTTTGKETAVDVTVNINNPDEKIKQGYTAKCTITTDVKDNGYIIPYEAIEMNSENKGVIYTFNEGKAIKKTVSIGNEYENGVEILSGIKSNDLIINAPEKVNNINSIKINKLLEINDD